MHVSPLTLVLQAALPVCLILCLAVTLQAFVLQQSFLSLQLPQTRLQTLSVAHLEKVKKTLYRTTFPLKPLRCSQYKFKPNWTFRCDYENFAGNIWQDRDESYWGHRTENQVSDPANIKSRTETQRKSCNTCSSSVGSILWTLAYLFLVFFGDFLKPGTDRSAEGV